MQDAHEAVTQGAQGLVVGVAGGAVLVIESPCAGACGDGAEGPLVDGVIEASVAHVAGQHGPVSFRMPLFRGEGGGPRGRPLGLPQNPA